MAAAAHGRKKDIATAVSVALFHFFLPPAHGGFERVISWCPAQLGVAVWTIWIFSASGVSLCASVSRFRYADICPMLSESWKTNVPFPSSDQRCTEPHTDTELKPGSYRPAQKTKLNPMNTSLLKKCTVFAFFSFPPTLVVLRRTVQGN